MTLLTNNTAQANTGAYVATERLYLDKDGKVVKEGDPDRVELLVGVNGVLPRERASELGLITDAPCESAASVTPAPTTAPPAPAPESDKA